MFRSILFFTMTSTSAIACDFCSSSAVLTPSRAACFVEIFEDRLSRLERSGRGFVQVDLESCKDIQSRSDTRSTVGTSLDDRSDAYAKGANLFLDEGQLKCLQNMISGMTGRFEPELLVQLPSEC